MKHIQTFLERAEVIKLPKRFKPDPRYLVPRESLDRVLDTKSLVQTLAIELGYEGKIVEYKGGGAYGLAFEILGEDKILKLTFDQSEAYIANSIRQKNTKHLINYYDVRHVQFNKEILDASEEDIENIENLYVLVMDKVRTLSKSEKVLFDGVADKIRFNKDVDVVESNMKRRLSRSKKTYNFTQKQADEFTKDATKIISDIVNALHECEKLGLKVTDIHHNNVGYDSNGDLILFDLSTVGKYNYKDSKSKLKSIEIDYEG